MTTLLITHLVIAATAALLGYAAGYEAGRVAQTHHLHPGDEGLDPAYSHAARTSHHRSPPPMSTPTPRPRSWTPDRAAIAYLIGSLALILAAWTAYAGQAQQREDQACLATFANQLADVIDARSATPAVAAREAAEVTVFAEAAKTIRGSSRGDLAGALAEYEVATRALQQERANNPYPDPPREVCGN